MSNKDPYNYVGVENWLFLLSLGSPRTDSVIVQWAVRIEHMFASLKLQFVVHISTTL